ncbi:serine hydrolase domain-containing protein [Streptomyces sp. NPDC058877]|uniref:serine hydrolase domain-containing protein n=1 Tax=unclassified Streptomyces TaxID=2593676 RepID=UPI0036AD3F54
MRIRLALWAVVAALGAGTGAFTAAPASGRPDAPPAGGAPASTDFHPTALQRSLDDVHRAGVPGVFAEVRNDGRTWRGASGVADVATGRPVRADMRHRVGSITKTFTAAAVLQQVERGRIRLDAPVGDHLPDVVPGERGRKITVRMLLHNTSGIPDYLPYAFPSLQGFPDRLDVSTRSLDDNRFRTFRPAELIDMGLSAPPVGEPGGSTGVYSNTNWLILGELLERVTEMPAEEYITRNVIERAGLRHTGFPTGPHVEGPHPRMYESFYGLVDPPRDYSVYDASWVGTAAALVSTMDDLNRFYARLLTGDIVSRASLDEMKRTVPARALDGSPIQYGLGLHRFDLPCGTFWGHDGTVWGAGTMSMSSADGKRQMSVAVNLIRWNEPDASGKPQPHPIDGAMRAFTLRALCGTAPTVPDALP